MKYTLGENHNWNNTYDLFTQDSEKLLVIYSMIKMTWDFLQPKQFTNMTYVLEIQKNYYLFVSIDDEG